MDQYIGGSQSNRLKVIGRLSSSNEWSRAGSLNTERYGHGAIFVDGFLMVIGGTSNFSTEKCSIINEAITCESQNPILSDYAYYPELFLVPSSYCSL